MLFAITPSLEYTLENETPSGEDWNRHSVWIEQYISGDISPMFEYPPIFHLFMTPFYYILRFPNIRYLQPVFSLLAILSTIYLSYKTMDLNGVLMTSLLISTSVAFNQFSGALLPTTFDYIFFPIVIILFLEKRYKLSAFVLWGLIGTHLFGIFLFVIMFIYSYLIDKKFIKYLIIVILCCVVFLPSYVPTLYSTLTSPGRWENDEMVIVTNFTERFQLWTTPWDDFLTYPIEHFLLFSGFLIWFLLPLTLYSMYKYPKYNKIQLLFVIWFIVLLPLIFFNIWRWWGFAVMPVSLFCGSVISNYMREQND